MPCRIIIPLHLITEMMSKQVLSISTVFFRAHQVIYRQFVKSGRFTLGHLSGEPESKTCAMHRRNRIIVTLVERKEGENIRVVGSIKKFWTHEDPICPEPSARSMLVTLCVTQNG